MGSLELFSKEKIAIVGSEDLPELRRAIPEDPQTREEYRDAAYLSRLVKSVEKGVAAAHVRDGSEKGAVDTCAISMTSSDHMMAEITRGIKADNFPGPSDALNEWVKEHELAHCQEALKDGKPLSPSMQELYADYEGTREYLRKGGNPEIPYAMRDVRAMGAMNDPWDAEGRIDTHVYGVFTPLPGEKFSIADHYTTNNAAGQDLLKARGDVFSAIGEDSYSHSIMSQDALKAVKDAVDKYGMPMAPSIQAEVTERLNPSMDKLFKTPSDNYARDVAVLAKIDISGYEGLVSSLAEQKMRDTKISLGEGLAKEQPELLYERSRQMLESGAFDNNPAGQVFVERFVDGAQRYSADHYGVAPEERLTARPEIVDQLAQQYAPVARPTHNTTIQLQ